jgi:trigger factor
LLLSEVGRENDIAVTQEETERAITEAAMKYSGKEREVMEFYRSHPEAAEELHGPILEDKVIDFIAGKAKITERKVSSKELLDDSNIPPLGRTRKRKGKTGAKKKTSAKASAKKAMAENKGKAPAAAKKSAAKSGAKGK